MMNTPSSNNIKGTNVDAHFVQSLGARVNNNKSASELLNRNGVEGLQIDRKRLCFDLPPLES